MEKKKKFPGLILQRLLTPSVSIGDALLLRKIKLLSGLLLAFIGGSILYSFLYLAAGEGFIVNFFWINGTCLVLAIGYWLNRRGHYRWAAILSTVFLSISILVASMLTPGNPRYLFVMVIPMLLGNLVLSPRGLLILGASILVGMVGLTALGPGITFDTVIFSMVFFSTLTGLLLMFIHHHNQLQAAREEELTKKETQYRSLAENINEVIFTTDTEHKRLQDQLHQAQKMESIGRLAGGVAHDFNNLLTVIIGYCEMLLDDTKDNPTAASMVKGINRAAERAASLTKQLLAFSRKQIIQPKHLNINELIFNLEKMLRRLISEHIALIIRLEAEPGIIKVDPAQLEQVLMNLAVNARDAMPGGGKLTIETSNIYLDDAYCRLHSGLVPGDYVMLSISDTGCGMDEKTEENIFEPFFTTKEPGKGTGLGLSTVYGIVKQSGGHIGFYSQLQKGTTFNIYIPMAADAEAAGFKAKEQESKEPKAVEGSESLLVVEDQEHLREMMVESLKLYGYRVIAAQDGAEALEICQQKKQSFDLLITDVVMPEMNGKELAEKIVRQSPGIKTLYISGYTEDTIGDHHILLEGLSFLPKPFSPTALAQKVRQILDTGTSK
jgi:signal transduction histidine kinase/CheY-like chemotaxis protein